MRLKVLTVSLSHPFAKNCYRTLICINFKSRMPQSDKHVKSTPSRKIDPMTAYLFRYAMKSLISLILKISAHDKKR